MNKFIASIIVLVLLTFGYSSSVGHSVQAASEIYPERLTFFDEDFDEGEIGGEFSFEMETKDDSLEGYRLTFDYNQVVAEIKASGKNKYVIKIPENTKVPEQASNLHLELIYKKGEEASALGRSMGLIDNTANETKIPTEINIHNELFVSYSETPDGLNSAVLAPYISVEKNTDVEISYAVLYFIDENGNKLKELGQMDLSDSQNGVWFPPLTGNIIPSDTAAIGVFAKNSMGESKDYIGVGLLNEPDSRMDTYYFLDTDSTKNQITGTLTWDAPKSENYIKNYGVYIVSEQERPVQQLGQVVPTGQKQYSISIPKTKISSGDYIKVVPEFNGYYNGTGAYVNFQDKNSETMKPKTLQVSEIKVTSNPSFYEFVIETLKAGDTIIIYDKVSKGNKIYEWKIDGMGYISFTLDRNINLNTVYFSVTNAFGVEGDRTAVQLERMKISPALSSKNITATNNTTPTNDEVNVKGVKKGDTVRVYDFSKKLLKEAKVSSGTSITVKVKQLGTKAGKINVTVQKSGMSESSFTSVSFKQETVKAANFVTNILKTAKGNILHANKPEYYMLGMQEAGQIWLGYQSSSYGDEIFYNGKLSKVTKSSATVAYELNNGKKGTGNITLKNNVLTLKYKDSKGKTITVQFPTSKKEQEKIIKSF